MCEDEWEECEERLDRAIKQCEDYTNEWDYISTCPDYAGAAVDCDECFDGQIESINSQIRYLGGGVTQYDSCYTLKETVLAQLNDVSLDIDALVLKLQQDDTEEWQAAFTQYSMACSYIPDSYCAAMTRDGQTACQVCDGSCVDASSECD